MKNELTRARLKELLHYDRETGMFTWLVNRGSRGRAGAEVGCPTTQGYLRVMVDKKLHYLHRLAWLYETGRWPTEHIDHKNGCVSDNRFVNLRDVSRSTNLQNERKARSNNRCGLLGVETHKDGRYRARIRVGGLRIDLGGYATAIEAHEVYLAAKRNLQQGCTI